MAEFARMKHRAPARSQISRANSPTQSQKRNLSSIIGNQAMQRLLQREAEEQVPDVPFSAFQASVIQAVNTLGGAVTPDYVDESKHKGSLMTAVLRVGLRSHRLQPMTVAQMTMMKEGKTKSGTIEGAGQLVYIKLQSLPGKSRVTVKVVDVETSSILSTGSHDFDASSQAMTDAVMHALVQMGIPWMHSKEPYSGSSADM